MKYKKLSYEKLLSKKYSYKNLPIVITGQPNNGKITLMARLFYETGSMPDKTIKEIKRITKELGKDTGFAFIIDQFKKEQEKNKALNASHVSFLSGKRAYCIVNTPGYIEFAQVMFTGAIHVRALILMIDVSVPVAGQVNNYANIFKLFRIENLIVLCNKMDCINYGQKKYNNIQQELHSYLSHCSLYSPVYIPISAQQGDCIFKKSSRLPWYKGPCFLKALDSISPAYKVENKPFRFPVQDVYTINRESVIVGRIASGSVQRGDRIIVHPGKKEASVAGIKIFHKKNIQKARAMENIGLILDRSIPVNRGDVIVHSPSFIHNRTSTNVKHTTEVNPVTTLKAHIFWAAGSPLKTGNKATLLCATQEVRCTVERIKNIINALTLEVIKDNSDTLELHQAGTVTLTTDHPVVVDTSSFIEEMRRILLKKGNMVMGAGFV